MEFWIKLLEAVAPILVAFVTIVPTIISNRKKTQESIDKLQKTLDEHIKEDEDDKARTQRYRILRFFDEMCENKYHSESHFEDILDDIDAYEAYCRAHPGFVNNRGRVAMATIQEVYEREKNKGINGFKKRGEATA